MWNSLLYAAQINPDRIAIECKEEITYKQLYQCVEELISKITIEKNTVVLLIYPRGIEFVVAMLAAIARNCIFVPIDSSISASKLRHINKELQPSSILISKQDMPDNQFEEYLSDFRECQGNEKHIHLKRSVAPHNISKLCSDGYIMYTSGSTGRPKGVIQSQSGLLSQIRNYIQSIKISSNDRLSLFAPIPTDAAFMDIFGSLLSGATLCICTIYASNFPTIANWVERNRISIFHSIPTLYRYFANCYSNSNSERSLRLIVLGGEPVRKQDLELFQRKFPASVILCNGYGPTECTVALQCFFEIDEDKHLPNEIPIGWPVEGVGLSFVSYSSTDTGNTGELRLKSKSIALGYVSMEQASNSIELSTEDSFYNTGDLVRQDRIGIYYYVGRIDSRFKVNGNWINSLEVERDLIEKLQLEDCVLILDESDSLQAFTVFIKPPSTNVLDDEHWISLVREFSDSDIPIKTITIETEFPKTDSGKIDHIKLAHSIRSKNPRLPTNTDIARIFSEALNCSVNTETIITAQIALNSIDILEILGEIETKLGVNVALFEFFDFPSADLLAQHLLSREKQNKIRPPNQYPPIEYSSSFDLSPGQFRYWERRDELDHRAWNLIYITEFKANIRKQDIEVALAKTIQASPLLTARILGGSQPSHDISPCEFNSFRLDTSSNVQLATESYREMKLPLDEGSLFRATLVEDEEDRIHLVWSAHHIVFDAWSRNLFTNQLHLNLCNRENDGFGGFEYRDFVDERIEEIESLDIESRLKLLEASINHHDNRIPVNNSASECGVTSEKSHARYRLLSKACRKLKVSPFTYSSMVFRVFILLITGSESSLLTTDLTQRSRKKWNNVIGLFTEVLILPNTIAINSSFEVNVLNEATRLTFALKESHLPLKNVFDSILPGELKNYHCHLPFAIFYEKENLDGEHDSVWAITREASESATTRPLILVVSEESDTITLSLESMQGYFYKQDLELHLKSLCSLFDIFLQDSATPIQKLLREF